MPVLYPRRLSVLYVCLRAGVSEKFRFGSQRPEHSGERRGSRDKTHYHRIVAGGPSPIGLTALTPSVRYSTRHYNPFTVLCSSSSLIFYIGTHALDCWAGSFRSVVHCNSYFISECPMGRQTVTKRSGGGEVKGGERKSPVQYINRSGTISQIRLEYACCVLSSTPINPKPAREGSSGATFFSSAPFSATGRRVGAQF